MKVTVDLPESELKEICFFTGETKKGAAIRKMVAEALMLKRREALSQKFVSGEWGTELAAFEAGQSADRRFSEKSDGSWRAD